MKTKTILLITLLPLLPLSLPLAAMAFRLEGWAWGVSDFVVGWLLLAGVGFAYVWSTRKTLPRAYRFATGLALGTAFLLVWINGAVGIIGSENNRVNLLYAGVLLVGFVSAALARLKPEGMARALFATASAQFLVPLLALFLGNYPLHLVLWQMFGLNGCFVALFFGSACLFRHAARIPNPRSQAAVN